MREEKASGKMLHDIFCITQKTIDAVYPRYYPAGAVSYFKSHHSLENIAADIEGGFVYVLREDNSPVATVTVKENHILRLFVLPECQHKGLGKFLLDFAEQKIFESYEDVILDASFPAKHIYLKRGYLEKEFCSVQTENGDFLCYDIMGKTRSSSMNCLAPSQPI